MNGNESATLGGRLLACVAAAYVATRVNVDPDLWGHLRFGLDILDSRILTPADRYSFTSDVPWINHEWLGDVLQALAFRIGGTAGLVALKVAVVALAFAVIASVVWRAREPYRWWLLAAGIVGMTPIASNVRPQLWTILGVALVWRALEAPRLLRWLPLVFMLWANLHGGWILGAGCIAFWILGRAIDERSIRAVQEPIVWMAAAIAATLINPYGWHAWTLLASSAGTARNIGEWRPLWEQPGRSFALLWSLAAAVVAVTMLRRRINVTYAATLPVAWLAMNSLFVTRLGPLFGEVAVMSLAGAWSSPAPFATTSSPLRRSILAIDILAVLAASVPNLVAETRCLRVADTWTPDVKAAGSLAAAVDGGRLVLPIDWGEFAIWQWGPRLRVSIDGRIGATTRSETVYSGSVIRTQAAVETGQEVGLEFLRRVRPEYVWLRTTPGERTKTWLVANGYRIDVQTDRSFIATRADLPALPSRPPTSPCFP